MKKSILTVLSLCCLFTTGLFIYESTQKPEAAAMYNSSTTEFSALRSTEEEPIAMSASISAEDMINLQIAGVSYQGVNVFYFYKPECNDSIYLQDNLLKPLLSSLTLSEVGIKAIDISSLDETYLPSTMKKNWGFENYPAFVQANINEDQSFEVLNVLEWNPLDPSNEYELTQWLTTVNSIVVAEEQLGEPIAKPLN